MDFGGKTMRDIKFRAWKKVGTQEMFRDIQAIDFKKGFIFIDYKVSELTIRTDKEKLENVVLMQYTGLKDENGVEIYEGDIVKSQNGTGGLIYKHIVEWNNFYKRFDPMGTDESCFNRESYEVIGNIYENPELLEGN